jgi:ATP-dependent Lon protease
VVKLQQRIDVANHVPADLREKVSEILVRLSRQAAHGSYAAEFESVSHYIDWVVSMPWNNPTKDILDLGHVKQVLDQYHYGLEPLKERFLEYLSILVLNEQKDINNYHAPTLLLVGLVGTGKTTICKSIAEGLGRRLVRIPFGGMSSALDLRGQSKMLPDSEPGQVIKGLRRAGSSNPIILLDEIDRVSENARGEIMGVLVELLDPSQNNSFVDHYLDYPVDLSQSMFIATCNNTTHIATAVMDRMEPILMPSYTDDEKIHIARDYILPLKLATAALPKDALKFDDNVWPKLVRPLGFDAGIRTLERTIDGIVRKTARQLVEGKTREIIITEANLKHYLSTF